MSMNDPISDMITRIRNGQMSKKIKVGMPSSNLKTSIAKVLKDEGFIKSFKIIAKDKADIRLKVLFKEDAILGLQRVSRPGLRKYSGSSTMPRVLNGLGVAIVSTSKGVITGKQAKQMNVGGEVLCYVY